MADPFRTYRHGLQSLLATGQATEHAYRSALQRLLHELGGVGVTALNEAQQVEHNAPDFIIQRDEVPIGYVECKDVGNDLDGAEQSEQLRRYRQAFSNLLLTNYLEFRWYVRGKRRAVTVVGVVTPAGQIRAYPSELHPAKFFERFFDPVTLEIRTAAQLAQYMAGKAQLFKTTVASILADEGDDGALKVLFMRLREVLIPDLTEEAFSDMYAQSAAYGLFAARCVTFDANGGRFTRQQAIMAVTTPLLNHMFGGIAGAYAHPRLEWIVDEIAYLVSGDYMRHVLEEFSADSVAEDPVVHFYEDFLRAYNPDLSVKRGVYYTPRPVVQFIVRSIDRLLETSFGLADGLANQDEVEFASSRRCTERSSKVTILDPAAGTGTFLKEVVHHIHHRVVQQGMAGIWPRFVRRHLLNRLIGFELLIAPYTICHLKLALELKRLRPPVSLSRTERFRVHLTNTLNRPVHNRGGLYADPIAAEAIDASIIRADTPIMVILGNPPYRRNSVNTSAWITNLLKGVHEGGALAPSYYAVDGVDIGEKQRGSIADDYVKFIRFAQFRIDTNGEGILGIITNHAYLDNVTFRAMRKSLLESFTSLYVLDLHGDAFLSINAPLGAKDENVFDIQKGVAIALFVKCKHGNDGLARVFHADLWGDRNSKYLWLAENDVASVSWQEVVPEAPYYMFVPRHSTFADEYRSYFSVVGGIFSKRTAAIQTGRDSITTRFTKEELWDFVQDLVNLPHERVRVKHHVPADSSYWAMQLAEDTVRESGPTTANVQAILMKAYDVRFTYYTEHSKGFLSRPVYRVMQHMVHGANLGLLVVRTVGSNTYNHVWITDTIANKHVIKAISTAADILPLYSYLGRLGRQSNVRQSFVEVISDRLNLTWVKDGQGDGESTFGPEDVLYYIYACLHSPQYRSRYLPELKVDFPRVPVTDQVSLFWHLVDLGDRLAQLHLMRRYGSDLPGFPVPGTNKVESVRSRFKDGRIWLNGRQYFAGVNEEVYSFVQCGYQPLKKWLAERKGRVLSVDDVFHFRYMHAAASATMRLMDKIDVVIDKHGGWPLQR